MAIAARCPTCGKAYQLTDEQAGLRVRCRECKNEFDVPRVPEALEAVAPRPRPAPRFSDDRDGRPAPVVQQGSGNKTLFWVLGLLGGGVLLLVLVCGGVAWMLTMQVSRTATQVSRDVEEVMKKAEMAQKEAERVEQERKKAEGKLPDLPNLDIVPDPKDFDDALDKLRSPNWLVRSKALSWINQQQPPADAAKRKKILDAVEERTKDENNLVRIAAETVKITWMDP